jgi:DNA repair protein RecN (Recombination protein N)
VLADLKIRNLALIDSVELELKREFIAITGETGAGKSVLVTAIRLLAGARAEKTIVRQGTDACEVQGLLSLADTAAIDAVLDELGLPRCDEGQLVISRIVGASKPSKVTINGALSTINALQKLGALWLEYNSPTAVLELYTPDEQLALLDRFGGVDASAYGAAYSDWHEKSQKLEEALTTGRLSEDEIAFLQRQLEKIDDLKLSQASIDELEEQYKRLSHLEEEIAISSKVVDAFASVGELSKSLTKARGLASHNSRYVQLVERLESLIIDADDQQREWREAASEADMSQAERDAISQKMSAWLELKRRHGSLEGVMAYREQISDKLTLQQNMADVIAQYEADVSKSRKSLDAARAELLKSRQTAAAELTSQILPILKKLGLPKAQIEPHFAPTPEPTANGGVAYELYFNANPGQEIKPLREVASSGELSRVMLALKTVLIRAGSKPVVIFDEIDANVGGEVANSVAELLSKLGAVHQVFCITHLPQVAARANFHLLVEKKLHKSDTKVSITPISDNRARLAELARMIGDRDSATALDHAKVLLG